MKIDELITKNGFLQTAIEDLKSRLETDKNGILCYPRCDISGRDFYDLIPIDYITEDEREMLESEIIEDLIKYDFDNYDWNGLSSEDVEDELYDFLFWELLKSIC